MSTKVIRLLLPFFDSAQRASSPSCKVEVRDPKKDDSTFVLKAQKALRRATPSPCPTTSA